LRESSSCSVHGGCRALLSNTRYARHLVTHMMIKSFSRCYTICDLFPDLYVGSCVYFDRNSELDPM
jgi:hypothetical protein